MRASAVLAVLAFAACSTSTGGGGSSNSSGAATAGKSTSGGKASSGGSTGKAATGGASTGGSTGKGGTNGEIGGGSTGKAATSGAAASSGGAGSTTGAASSSGGAGSTGAASSAGGAGSTTGSASTGAGSTSGGAASSGGAGTNGGYAGVLERGGGPLRDAVFQDAAFTQAAVGAKTGGLQVDPAFNSATWTGPVFSQPLYFVDGATGKSLIIVTTDSNEIYAVDPATGAAVWSVPQLVPPIGTSLMTCAGSVSPIGITGTPVIDPATRRLYLNAGTVVAGSPHYQIFAIDLDDGSTVSGWPVDVDGAPLALGNGGTGTFQSSWQNQRGALALVNGVLYVPYGGLDGDCGNYSGVVIAVPVANPTSFAAWATSAPSGSGIWGPSGVASDGSHVFVSTGNTNDSPFPKLWTSANSEAVLRFAPGSALVFTGSAADYFMPTDTPPNPNCNDQNVGWLCDDEEDADLGSSGVVLFDDPSSSSHPHLAFAIGKTQNAYLLDRTNLGGYSAGLSEVAGASSAQVFGSMAAYTTPTATYVVATANGNGSCTGTTSAFAVSGDPPQLGGGWCSSHGGTGSPIVSTSDGSHDWIVWTSGGNLSALDGDTGNTLASIGIPAGYEHWVTPIIAQGALYLAGDTQLVKFDP